jgi:SAM-dependent methyltransferase
MKKRSKKSAKLNPSPYLLYESSVQSPEWQVNYLPLVHKRFTGKAPIRFREDFCGSGKIACEWVKKSKKHEAIGIDLAPEPLRYAEEVNLASLTADQKRRVEFHQQDVRRVTPKKFDLIGAFNFSFFVFHERRDLLKYARSAFKSLNTSGTFFLELAGGDGFMETRQEKRVIPIPGIGRVQMIWEQHQYDPITAVNDFSIHFRLPDGEWLNDAFRYHWRLWGIRDLREILMEAGFKKTAVLWGELNSDEEETGEFLPQENADYQKAWIAYVVGIK